MRPRPAASLALLLAVVSFGFFLLTLLSPPPAARYLRGEVHDPHGPAAGAVVRFKGRTPGVLSDSRGRFHLPFDRNSSGRITASKHGFFIAGSRLEAVPLRLTLHPLPRSDHPDYEWVDPDADPRGEHNCANCHREIHREWKASGHSRSATGRQFHDLYTGDGGWGLLIQHPDGRGVCTACHAPTVKPGDPALFDLSKVEGVPGKGVHCDYCHKIDGMRGDKIGLAHGRDSLTLLRPSEGQLFFGPLDDVDRGEDAFSAFYRDSRYCAACHEGFVFGVHVYSTHSEWLESPSAKKGEQCQSCHMKPTGRMTNIAPGKGGIERDPLTLGNHHFFDGSRQEMLRRCLRVEVERKGNRVVVQVRVEGVGHRVPTGFIDRHLILHVEGRDAAGRAIELFSGPRLPAAAGTGLAGKAGRLFAKLLKDEEGRSPAPFWKALPEAEDTRLRPGKTERMEFEFASEARSVRVRVIHRRFWEEVEKTKGWPASDLVVVDREWVD